MTKAEKRKKLYDSLRKFSYKPDTAEMAILTKKETSHCIFIEHFFRIWFELKKQGFNINPQAILHNLIAYNKGLKSGYRDEENKYFLFSPCNKNPLEFEVFELKASAKDWQYTYEA